MLKPGDRAPAFSLTGDDGKNYTLHDFKDTYLILYFYPKNATPGEIIEGIQLVARGGSPMSAVIARRVVESFHGDGEPSSKAALSKREIEVLQHIARGKRIKEVAAELGSLVKARPPTSFKDALKLLGTALDLRHAKPKLVKDGPCKEVIHKFDAPPTRSEPWPPAPDANNSSFVIRHSSFLCRAHRLARIPQRHQTQPP